MLNGPKGFNIQPFADRLKTKPTVTPRGDDQEQIQIAFTALQQPRDPVIRKLLASHMRYASGKQLAK